MSGEVTLRSTTLGVAKGLGVGVAASLLAVASGYILSGGLAFAERIGVLSSETIVTAWQASLTMLVGVVALVVLRGGDDTIRAPLAPTHRLAGVIAAVVLGGFFLLVGSSLWTATAVGAGWAIAASAPDPTRSMVRSVPAVLVGVAGLLITPADLHGSVVAGLVGPVVAGVLLVAVIALETALD